MDNHELHSDPANPEMLDYSELIGGFMCLSQKGQMFALDGIAMSADFSKLAPRPSAASFQTIYPLVAKIRPSHILLVAHPGDRANAYLLMDIMEGDEKKRVRVRQETPEIIMTALESDVFPIVPLGELQKAAAQSRKNHTPLSLPVRYLELRKHLPDTWSAAVKDIFLANAESVEGKTEVLEEKLQILHEEIKTTMLETYLSKCMWLNEKSTMLGMVRCTETGSEFVPFDTGDSQITAFINSLDKTAEGRYSGRYEFANVLPMLDKKHPWISPTVHIYDPIFRAQHNLNEYYSLYNGMRALCDIGAPVLLQRPEGFESAIPLALLKPSLMSGEITQISVREFPTRDVVWTKLEF